MEAKEIIEVWRKHGVEVLPHFTEIEVCKEIAKISFRAGYEQSILDNNEWMNQGSSFKAGEMAGIKEVMEWGKETCPHDLFGEGTQFFKRVCDECWQEKERGINKDGAKENHQETR